MIKTYPVPDPAIALRSLIRQVDSHKGLYGNVAVIGGANSMIGAALLAGRAALKHGTGKVSIGLLNDNFQVDPEQPELMVYKSKRLIKNTSLTHILLGPGLGQSKKANTLLEMCLRTNKPLIIDADGLNLISKSLKLQLLLKHRQAETIITPHPMEAARLLQCDTSDIQENRPVAIIKLQSIFQCGVILKGHDTLVLGNNSKLFQNNTGNSALSSAGQGDVLGGIILALWAQGLSLIEACCCGVYIHGKAADTWRISNSERIGLTATETIEFSRCCLNNYL